MRHIVNDTDSARQVLELASIRLRIASKALTFTPITLLSTASGNLLRLA